MGWGGIGGIQREGVGKGAGGGVRRGHPEGGGR